MANRSSSKGRTSGHSPSSSPPSLPSFKEPEVRRWPHPVEGVPSMAPCVPACGTQTEPLLAEIHCVLAHQAQLLAEIRSLLEYLNTENPQESKEK